MLKISLLRLLSFLLESSIGINKPKEKPTALVLIKSPGLIKAGERLIRIFYKGLALVFLFLGYLLLVGGTELLIALMGS